MHMKPTALKVLKGTLQPCRTNPDEPKPTLVDRLPPPRDLPKTSRRAWTYLVKHLSVLRVVTEGDIPALRLLATEQADLWDMESGVVESSPIQRSAIRKQLLNALGRFGMTPVDRQRVAQLEAKKENGLAKFSSYPGKS